MRPQRSARPSIVAMRRVRGVCRRSSRSRGTRVPRTFSRGGEGFFDEHGWLSSHLRIGAPGDTEFRLQGRSLDGARVAVTYYDPERRYVLLAYPVGLTGDVVAHEIQRRLHA